MEDYEYDPEKEVVWTSRYIEENLLPADKQCRIVLWSGNCLPDEETLALCEKAGLQNMNGGDSRFDGEFPSYATVAPLYRQVGPYYQIHSSNSNENTYTNLWSGQYGAFQNVVQTFQNTESPRRILPIDVYYHFYSGERHASLLALQRVYAWVAARREEIFPVYASRFIDVVHGFIDARIERLGEGVWRVSNSGQCRTVRFDHCALYPDLVRSTGVLGFRHYQDCLYVALDETKEHVIALTDRPPDRPYLVQATADVLGLHRESGALRFRSAALGKATFVWADLAANTDFSVLVEGQTATAMHPVRSDTVGGLRFTVPLVGPAAISIAPAQ